MRHQSLLEAPVRRASQERRKVQFVALSLSGLCGEEVHNQQAADQFLHTTSTIAVQFEICQKRKPMVYKSS